MTEKNYILATAGHVDHGKSALVKALTGTDPDRLPEEKARGISIDLGFAHLNLHSSPDGQTHYHLGLIDVPGHEDFVKNMVAGVGSIDLALLVVAADDGWMPQSEEHLQILAYLGVTKAVVALNKIDLRENNVPDAVTALRQQLQGSPFAASPIIPTSTITGRGLNELKNALIQELAKIPPSRDSGKPRLPIDRVFSLHGIGTVVTGTLANGSLQRGQMAVLQPTGKATRIRSLQTHHRDVPSAMPGMRTALNLPDMAINNDAASMGSASDLERGNVLTVPEIGPASLTVDVLLEKSARLVNVSLPAARPLKDGALVRVHHGTADLPARVVLLESKALLPGEEKLAQLRFETPLFAFVGDHFILRDWPQQNTLAGGTVLDADADRRTFRTADQQTFLRARSQAPGNVDVLLTTQILRARAIRKSGLLSKSAHSAAEIAETLARLESQGVVFPAGEWVVAPQSWRSWRQQAERTVHEFHRAHPEKLGLPLLELRQAVAPSLPAKEFFDVLLNDLCRKEFVQTGTTIRSASHQPALPAHLQAAGTRLRSTLHAKPVEPPSRKEIAPDSVSQQALRFFVDTGLVVDLGEDVVLLAESFATMKAATTQFLRTHGSATVSDLRQTLNTTRRIMMPFLERLDREGITVRQGDKRVLKNPAKPAISG